jgi:adenosylcobinamide kinase/adenosylcobinamide-phosphate guanylyltransferase
MPVTLVLGGARSGKSRYAEGLAAGFKGPKAYVATAEPRDEEMQARIAQHRARRGEGWTTYEAPLDLVQTLAGCREQFILLDCLTLWISNLILAERGVASAVEALCEELTGTKAHVVIVSNEVGQGIVPDNALARSFRDQQGLANQKLAEAADEVVLMVAGLPLILKK